MQYKNYEHMRKNSPKMYNFYRKVKDNTQSSLFMVDEDQRIAFQSSESMKVSSMFEDYQNEQILEHILGLKATEVMVVGVGNAKLLQKLSEIKTKKIHIVEFVEYFDLLFSTYDLRKVNFSQFATLTFMQSKFDLNSIQQNLFKNSNFDIDFFFWPQYKRMYGKEVKRFYEEFKNVIAFKRTSVRANAAYEERWSINAVKNFINVAKTPNIIDTANSDFQNSIAFIISAGPSLNFEIEKLKSELVKDHAYLFAVGSANVALYNAGIEPDAIFSYDPKKKNANVLELHKKENYDTPIIFSSTVGFETLHNLKLDNSYHFILNQDTINKHFSGVHNPEKIVQDSPTVAIIAAQVLVRLGFRHIVFVGQNLALLDGKRYSKGVELRHYVEGSTQSEDFVEDVDGNMVETTEGFMRMRIALEQFIHINKGIEFINTTKKGSKIEGAPFEDMGNVMKRLDQFHKTVDFKNFSGSRLIENPDGILENIEKLLKLRNEFAKKLNSNLDVLREIAKNINEQKSVKDKNYGKRLYDDLIDLNKNVYVKDFLAIMLRNYLSILKTDMFKIHNIENEREQAIVLFRKYKTVYLHFEKYDRVMFNEVKSLERQIKNIASGV